MLTWIEQGFVGTVPTWCPSRDGDGIIAIEQHTIDNAGLESRWHDNEARQSWRGFLLFNELEPIALFPTLAMAQAHAEQWLQSDAQMRPLYDFLME